MNSFDAIVRGGLANKVQFLGTSTVEVVSRNVASVGGWNNDFADTVHSTLHWFGRGSKFTIDTDAGVFSFDNISSGGVMVDASHRAILSGY